MGAFKKTHGLSLVHNLSKKTKLDGAIYRIRLKALLPLCKSPFYARVLSREEHFTAKSTKIDSILRLLVETVIKCWLWATSSFSVYRTLPN
jgi:hypothetical protein